MNAFSQSSKGEILKGMMRRPETAKLIKEALASPIGSTSRAKAQKIFSIMNKLNTSHDGYGGPGMMYDQMNYSQAPEMDPVHVPTDNSKGMVIFHKIPKPKITFGNKASKFTPRAGSYDGLGGPSNYPVYPGMKYPGIQDGMGGFWSDLGNTISNAANTVGNAITNPTTVGKSILGSLPVIGPIIKTIDFAKPFTDAILPKTDTSSPTYDPGLISKGINWVTNTAIPAVGNAAITAGKGLVSGGLAIPAVNQYVYQNAAQAAINAARALVPHDTSQQVGPGYTSLYDTAAAQQIRNLWPGITAAAEAAAKNPPKSTTPITTTSTVTPPAPPAVPGAQTTGTQTSTTPGQTPGAASSSGSSSSLANFGTTQSRTDRHNNPTAFITEIAKMAGLVEGVDYTVGDPFTTEDGSTLYTARLLGDPIAQTIKVIDKVGFYTAAGKPRWNYIDKIPEIKDWANMSTEQKTAVIEKMYQFEGGGGSGGENGEIAQGSSEGSSAGSIPGTYSGVAAAAKAAVESGLSSPTTFAAGQMGGTLAEAQAANQKTVWDKYGLDHKKAEIEKLQAEVTALPKDMTDYISARDSYIKQTDQAIQDYKKQMESMDLSNPVVVQQTTSHLNYLYTLRGRQNQSYMRYLNDVVTQHETKLNNMITDYNSKLGMAESELSQKNEITKEEYTTKFNSLSELYQSILDAPTRELQMTILKNQANAAAVTSVEDQVDLDKKMGGIAQRDRLRTDGFLDDSAARKNMAKIGTNLLDKIGEYAINDPSLTTGVVINAYLDGVKSYLGAPTEKDEITGSGITSSSKKKMAEEAIRNFAALSAYGIGGVKNSDLVEAGVEYARDVANEYGLSLSSSLSRYSPQMIEAVKTLAPGGHWYTLGLTHGATPSLEKFTETMNKATNNDPLSDSIAKAVYAAFLRYTSTGSSPATAVEALTNNVTSTGGRTPYTAEEFASIISRLYLENILIGEFSANQDSLLAMQSSLYPSTQ